MRVRRGNLSFNARHDSLGVSTLLATLMTISTLLILGSSLVFMAISMTPREVPAVGALDYTRNASDNYTVKIITLSSPTIKRNHVSVVVLPNDPNVNISQIIGQSEYLSSGDCFTVSNLHPGMEYTVRIEYKGSGATIASTKLSH